MVLRCLLYGAVSRAQIVELTGLSKSTVTSIIGELIAKGAVIETGTESSGVGRPRTSLAPVAHYGYAVGMVLHRRHLSVSLIDLALKSLDTLTFPTSDFASPEAALDSLFAGVETLCRRNAVKEERLIGIGVSAPGPLDYKEGIIHTPPGLSLFHGAHVKEYLSQKTSLPVFLDNNATLLAMHEKRLRREILKNWTFIVVTDGIGSASFSDGKLLRGKNGYAGELGHISVKNDGALCACGNRGCLEHAVSTEAIREKFGFESYKHAVHAAARGEETGKEALSYIASLFAQALAGPVNLLDPEAVVLYGEYNEKHELLFPLIEKELKRRSAVARQSDVMLLPSLLTEDAIIASSADAILDAYFLQKFN